MSQVETVNKAQAVRDYMKKNKRAKPAAVAEALAAQGIDVKAAYVRNVVSKTKKASKKARGKGPQERKTAQGKGQSWTFPKNTLEEAILIPRAIEEKNAGNPMTANGLARAVGFRQAQDWRFLDQLRSANLYGLVSGSGKTAIVQIVKLGQDIVAPSSPKDRQMALLAAFNKVEGFKAAAEFYGNKKIPEDEFFLNTLTREFKVPRERVDVFAEVFMSNLEYLRAFDVPQTTDSPKAVVADAAAASSKPESIIYGRRLAKKPRPREFLDTCFVMMPFGEWFDKYYQEIFVPAIKEAGFEPVRADELFSTGTVVEQIWEQIRKARVLLADLSDRNANVFYELGLAHAAIKPVVFVAPQVDDVPFDLRHLRVILYDIREPYWADQLRERITDYLRNAQKEPDKSIPHPFRTEVEEKPGTRS